MNNKRGRRFGIPYPDSPSIRKSQEETARADSKVGTIVLSVLAVILVTIALILILVLGSVLNLYRMTKDVATGVSQVTGIVEFLENITGNEAEGELGNVQSSELELHTGSTGSY